MKKNFTATDRVTVALEAMYIREFSRLSGKADDIVAEPAHGLACRMAQDQMCPTLTEGSFARLLAVEHLMCTFSLCHFYVIQQRLGVSPISALAAKAHDAEVAGYGSREWKAAYDERLNAISAHNELAKVAA